MLSNLEIGTRSKKKERMRRKRRGLTKPIQKKQRKTNHRLTRKVRSVEGE